MIGRAKELLAQYRAYAIAVALPTLLLAVYYVGVASDRYVSQAQLIVEGDDSASLAVAALGILAPGGGEAGLDAELVKNFILSPAMLEHLDRDLALREHFSAASIDPFSRLSADASREDFHDYYLSRVEVVIGETAPIIDLRVQGFDPVYAQKLAQAIADRAERFVNEVSQSLAREQVAFVHEELDKANARLRAESAQLIDLQNRNRMLDPVLESQAVAQIIGGLQQELARLRTEQKALESFLSASAPEVVSMRKKISAVERQIEQERAKQVKAGESRPLNDLVLTFKESELSVQVAADVYQAGLKSLEAAKLDASRKVKHLVRISAPTLPEDALMPRRLYNLATVFVLLNLAFWVGRLLVASIRDHRE